MKLFSRSKSQGTRTATIAGTDKVFEVPAKDSVLNEALAAGIPFPHSCTVGTCGTCKRKLVHGKVREIVDPAIALTAQELRAGYIQSCQSIARTSMELGFRAVLPEEPPQSAWTGARGFVTDAVHELPNQLPHDCHTYTPAARQRFDALETAFGDIRADMQHFYAGSSPATPALRKHYEPRLLAHNTNRRRTPPNQRP